MEKTCRRLVQTIREVLAGGIAVGPEVGDFIGAGEKTICADALNRYLRRCSDAERDTLLALIFFPDESIQLRIEAMLAQVSCSHRQLEAVQQHVLATPVSAALQLIGSGQVLRLAVPADTVAAFLARLNLQRRLDPEFEHALGGGLCPRDRLRARVMWRNAKTAPGGSKSAFLAAAVRQLSPDPRFFEILSYLLEFLDLTAEDVDFCTALAERKQTCVDNLQNLEKDEARVRTGCMEAHMLSGRRVPYIDRAACTATIMLIDRILWAVCPQR
jgi:hypothetical protein